LNDYLQFAKIAIKFDIRKKLKFFKIKLKIS